MSYKLTFLHLFMIYWFCLRPFKRFGIFLVFVDYCLQYGSRCRMFVKAYKHL